MFWGIQLLLRERISGFRTKIMLYPVAVLLMAQGLSESLKAALRLTGVQAYYGESHILHGVDLTVRRGEVVTLLGRNGAGRTTTIKSILGLVGRRTGGERVRNHVVSKGAWNNAPILGKLCPLSFCPT